MDPKLAFGAAGSFLSLADPLGRVQAYIEQAEETREVKARLRLVLQPLEDYEESLKASKESGHALRIKVDGLSLPLRIAELEDLLTRVMNFTDDFTRVVSGVLGFARASSILVSDMETFMQKVQRTMPEIAEIIKFFGKHFDPKTGSLDLAHFPTFFAVHVMKVEDDDQSENEELSKQVAEGGKSVDKAMKAAKYIGQQAIRIRDRHLKREFPDSFQGFNKQIRKLKATTEVAVGLSKSAPPWLVALAEIMERVQKHLEEQSKPVYRSPPFKTTAHR